MQEKRTNKELFSARDYFFNVISVISALSADDFKLTPKEIEFLVECCIYNYEGKDLTRTSKLSKHLISNNFFTKASDIATYKYKVGVKKWAKTTKGMFTLPPDLNKKKGDVLSYNLSLKMNEEKVYSR